LGTTGLYKLTNLVLAVATRISQTLEQSRGDNRLCRRFHKYPTFTTLCEGWVKRIQVCLENMCNFPNLRFCLYHTCWLYC